MGAQLSYELSEPPASSAQADPITHLLHLVRPRPWSALPTLHILHNLIVLPSSSPPSSHHRPRDQHWYLQHLHYPASRCSCPPAPGSASAPSRMPMSSSTGSRSDSSRSSRGAWTSRNGGSFTLAACACGKSAAHVERALRYVPLLPSNLHRGTTLSISAAQAPVPQAAGIERWTDGRRWGPSRVRDVSAACRPRSRRGTIPLTRVCTTGVPLLPRKAPRVRGR